MPESKKRKKKKPNNTLIPPNQKSEDMFVKCQNDLVTSIDHITKLLAYIDKVDGTIKDKAEQLGLLDYYHEQCKTYKESRDMIQSELDKLETKRKELKDVHDLTNTLLTLSDSFNKINGYTDNIQKFMMETTGKLDDISSGEKDGYQ